MNKKSDKARAAGIAWDVTFILRFRILFLIIFIALTAFLCFQLKGLKMEPEALESLYPAGHAFLPQLQAIKKMAPPPRMLIGILEVKEGDIYTPETVRKIDRITKALTSIEGILPGGITSLTRGMEHYNNTAQGLSIEPVIGNKWPETQKESADLKRKIAVNPKGLGRYVAYDGTAAMITAPIVDIEQKARTSYQKLSDSEKAGLSFDQHKKRIKGYFQEKLLKVTREIQARENNDNHTLFFMGPQLIEAQMTAMGRRHIPMAAAATAAIIVLMLAVCFRTFTGVFIPLFAMSMSLLWGLGACAAFGIAINPMALTFPLILGLFTLAASVSAVKQYYYRYSVTGDKDQAIRAAYNNAPVTWSILTIGLTTMMLHAAQAPIFVDLAGLSLFWLIGALVTVAFVTPILLSFLPAPNQSTNKNSNHTSGSFASAWWTPSTMKKPWLMLVLLAALLALGAFAGSRLKIGNNTPGASYIRASHPWNQCFDLLSRKFMGPYQLLVYVKAKEKGGLLKAEAMNAIGDFSRYMTDQLGARDSIAFDMMIKTSRIMLTDGNPKWQIVPASKEKIEGLAGLVIEQGGIEEFIDKTFTEATISPFFPEKDSERIDEYITLMQAYIDRHPSNIIEFRLGGGLLGMTKTINDGTQSAYTVILSAAFFLVFVLSMLGTRSLFLGLVITPPIAAAQAVIWLIMMAAGIKINLPAVIASAPAIGFGALFGYHLVRPFIKSAGGLAERQKDFYEMNSMVLFSGILVFAAMLPWFFIGLKFESDLILTAGTTILLEAVFSLLYIPVILDGFKPYDKKTTSDALRFSTATNESKEHQ